IPRLITDREKDYLAIVSNIGLLLIFPLNELPELAKGKGNKMLSIPSGKFATREEYVVDIAVLSANQNLLVVAEDKIFTLKPSDWQHFLGTRAHRGHKLPRGCRRVMKLNVANVPNMS